MANIKESKYGFGITISGPFGNAVERVKAAFKEQGFGTLCEINVQSTLREKIGEEIEPYTILGVCNPKLASKAIAAEHEIGLLLPCNVIVHECEGHVNVSVQDPALMVEVTANSDLEGVATDAKEGLSKALLSLL